MLYLFSVATGHDNYNLGDTMDYDAWLEAPYMEEGCECDGGCHRCDAILAEDYHWSTDPRV